MKNVYERVDLEVLEGILLDGEVPADIAIQTLRFRKPRERMIDDNSILINNPFQSLHILAAQ